MPEDFITKMAKYVAFLYREFDSWKDEPYVADQARYFLEKINTVREVCEMFGCASEIWSEARKIYRW